MTAPAALPGVASPVAAQRLTGSWEGPGVALQLTEAGGLVTGSGVSQGVPVDVTGGSS